MSSKLTKIELFLFNTKPTFYNDSNKINSPHILLKVSCTAGSGYGICPISPSESSINLICWGAFLKCITSATLDEALHIVQQKGREWSFEKQTLLNHALLNIVELSSQNYLKVASGHSREETYVINTMTTTQPFGSIDLSLLIKESSSYYSPFVRHHLS